MEDVKKPSILMIVSLLGVCLAAVFEIERYYILDDNILIHLTHICFYILSGKN